MIIAGANGLAKELLEVLAERNALEGLCFFDNVSPDTPSKLYNRFPVLRTFEEVQRMFEETGDRSFVLGLGNPILRRKLCDEFSRIGGVLTSVVSTDTRIGQFGTKIAPGCCILPGVVITADVSLGRGCLLNPNVTVSHDSVVGEFVEMGPGVSVTGNCVIGDYTFLGTNCVVLPKVRIGKNVIVGAGAVVTKDVDDNTMVAGVPAVVKKMLAPISF
jgi:sugar O-acyltransferase (sialic acid O-acetyltransferase NeuD family)